MTAAGRGATDAPLLRVENLGKGFGHRARRRQVLTDVSFEILPGQIFGLVGESGSGKSTTLRCLMGLEHADSGRVVFDGQDVLAGGKAGWKRFLAGVKLVFQDPYSSLDPRMTVGRIIAEPLGLLRSGSSADHAGAVADTLQLVGLSPEMAARYPRSFSGGQRQRIAIARALVTSPRLLVCDEPVSALDVSVQAQVLNLLRDMREELSLSILFVAHDLAVVRYLCDQVAVMEHGRIVENRTVDDLFDSPAHPYTRSLLEAVPGLDPEVEVSRRIRRIAERSRATVGG